MAKTARTWCLTSLAGLCLAPAALADSRIDVQVSRAAAEDWHSSIAAAPGDHIDIRVLISYTGADQPLGLAACIIQPTLSNWRPNGDTMLPLINGGRGGQDTTPIGAVHDAAGQYGRVIPYAQVATSSTSFLKGHVNNVGGVTYLRIAQSQVTNWFGDPGNATLGSGVNLLQLSSIGRTPSDPPFGTSLTNIVVFKYGITLDAADSSQRTLTADVPLQGVWPGSNGFPHIEWFVSMDEPTGSLREQPTIQSAIITVPAPPAVALLGAFGAYWRRRVRRSVQPA